MCCFSGVLRSSGESLGDIFVLFLWVSWKFHFCLLVLWCFPSFLFLV
jgi:hypothetical protein